MANAESIRDRLREGQGRISIGRAEEVAALVLAEPKHFTGLMECLWDEDAGVANRAAHALERVTREGKRGPAAQLNRWKTQLLGRMAEASENKMRWHLALIVPRLKLTRTESARAAGVLRGWLEDQSSSIVKTMSLQGLADLTGQDPSLKTEVLDLLRLHCRSGTAAMRARCRLLLEEFEGLPGRIEP